MGDIPYPITGETLEELREQVNKNLRVLFEDNFGGISLEQGSGFSVRGEVLNVSSQTVENIQNISVQSNITNIETNVSNIETNVTNIETNVTNIETNITNIIADLANLVDSIVCYDGEVVTYDGNVVYY